MLPACIKELIIKKAVFVANHSGGKDSQAMYIYLSKFIPSNQIIVIHADLPEVDWEGIGDHIISTIGWNYYKAVRANKTFFQRVEHRQMWPSPYRRYCTSDLKRGPIEKAIRYYMKKQNLKLIVNCMGIRAEESSSRAKAEVFKFDKRNSKAGREWYNWLPIHDWLETQVFAEIENNNQRPHWAYAAGMTRLSCCFCIMASRQDLKTASKLRPDLYKKYCDMERKIDHTFTMPVKGERKFLPEITGV